MSRQRETGIEGREGEEKFIRKMLLISSMEKICAIGLLAFVLVVAGASATEIPNLVGSWAGTGVGYGEEEGYVDEADYGILTMNITEQKGRIFNGEMTFWENGTAVVEGFTGATGSDNKTFYVAEFGSGYDVGTILSEDEIELLYLQDGEGGWVFIDTLRRVLE
jgi:hypothetical protein